MGKCIAVVNVDADRIVPSGELENAARSDEEMAITMALSYYAHELAEMDLAISRDAYTAWLDQFGDDAPALLVEMSPNGLQVARTTVSHAKAENESPAAGQTSRD